MTEKKIKMDVWEWGDIKGTDERLCDNIVSYAEENDIEYMEITEEEFNNLKNKYLMKTYGNKGVFNKKSIKEANNLKKSYKIIEDGLYDIMANDTVREEFNDIFNAMGKGVYRSVDEMFEVSVHNILNNLFREFTMED